uniref:Uncharacterized protein n=1 Tax=Romanomermis culicivorax TaxID=13658 RepID=A0A915L985_ROMCU
MAHPACEAPNGLCRTPGCFDYHHQNQGGAKFCRFCEPQQINIP